MGLKSKLTEVLKRQKAHGTDLRAWMHDMEVASSKRAKERAEELRKNPGRGVNRVPKHLQGLAPTVKYVVAHEDDNYRARRTMAKFSGGRMQRVPREDIAAFKARPGYKPKSSKGRKVKGGMRSSTNKPYVNPER